MKQFLALIVVCLSLSTKVLSEVCQTAACKTLSEELLHNSINDSVAPCDDFFDYVCGKWPATHPLPKGTSGLNYFIIRQNLVTQEIEEAFLNALNFSNVAVRSVAQFYSDCLDTATIEKRGMTPLVETIQRVLDKWPLLQKPSNKADTKKASHWQDLYVSIFSRTGLSPVFDLKSYYNSTLNKTIINIQHGILNNGPHGGAYPKTEAQMTAYKSFLHKLATSFFAVPDNDQLKADIEAVLHLEKKFFTAYNHAVSGQHWHFEGHFADLAIGLQNKADIQSIVNQILVKLSLTKVPPLTATDTVHVLAFQFLVEAVAILETTPVSVVQNWLGLMIAIQLGDSWSTAALQREIATFNNRHYDPAVAKAICNKLPMHWPAVQARIYIDKYFSPQKKIEAETLVKSLRIVFENDLQNHTEWLDEKTRKAALEKLEAIKQVVGYESWVVSDGTIQREYPNLNNQTIQRGKFFESAMFLQVEARQSNLATLHHDTSSTVHPGWMVDDPTIVNAFYERLHNTIYIPAGILQPPFFDHQLPYAINYGVIGTVIGHELTHAFDNHGALFDKNGKQNNWWTSETSAKFNEKSKCFVEQYGTLKDLLSGKMINGEITLAENIADNGGVKKAYNAYLEHQKALGGKVSAVLPNLKLTADQLFFTAYAHGWCENVTPDEAINNIFRNAHSPNRFRVNTVLGNTPAFAEAFSCPLGSKMNPVKKCSVW